MNKFEPHIYKGKKYWTHKTSLKCFVNPILRILQFFTDKPFIITSVCEFRKNQEPLFIKYNIQRVKHKELSHDVD